MLTRVRCCGNLHSGSCSLLSSACVQFLCGKNSESMNSNVEPPQSTNKPAPGVPAHSCSSSSPWLLWSFSAFPEESPSDGWLLALLVAAETRATGPEEGETSGELLGLVCVTLLLFEECSLWLLQNHMHMVTHLLWILQWVIHWKCTQKIKM